MRGGTGRDREPRAGRSGLVIRFATIASTLAAGCADTIVECNIPEARIFVDGRYQGMGTITRPNPGLLRTSDVRVEAPDGRVIHATIENPYHLVAQFRGGELGRGRARKPPPPPPANPWMQAPHGWKTTPRRAYDSPGHEAKVDAKAEPAAPSSEPARGATPGRQVPAGGGAAPQLFDDEPAPGPR